VTALLLPVVGLGFACASTAPKPYELPVGMSLYEPDPEPPATPARTAQPVEATPGTSFALPAPLRSLGSKEEAVADGGTFDDGDEGVVEEGPAILRTGDETVETVEP
jgi:hypothetical protein